MAEETAIVEEIKEVKEREPLFSKRIKINYRPFG